MRKNYIILLTFILIAATTTFAYDWSTNSGNGSWATPYQISEANQLNSIGTDPNLMDKNFILLNDIDLSEYSGTQYNIIGNNSQPFIGYFDGDHHTILNFSYTSTGANYIALFGKTGEFFKDTGQVRNLTLLNANVNAGTGNYVGALAGLARGSLVNCHVESGTIQGGDYVGGLCGNADYNTLANCHTDCNVEGDYNVGGLAGSGDLVLQCYATGQVTGVSSVGGLIGNQGGEINKCYATGDVVGLAGGDSVGGLVGIMYPDSSVRNSYARGNVTGNFYVGGLLGMNWDGTVTHCYSTGVVSGAVAVGGLVGNNNLAGAYDNCFWDSQRNELLSGVGAGSTIGIVGLETIAMKTGSTFSGAGWDFTTPVWAIAEGVDYPTVVFGEYVHDYGGGTGLEGEPFLIYTPDQMQEIGSKEHHWGMHFKLMNNIDLGLYDGQGGNPTFNKIGYYNGSSNFKAFTGTFDGNGHVISNFYYTDSNIGMVGLFGFAEGAGVVIKNLGLINPTVHVTGWNQQIGALVGLFRDGLVTNCYVLNADVSGETLIGTLAGRLGEGTITHCQASGTVLGTGHVGGLLGTNDEGELFYCDADVSVTATDWTSGGLVSENSMGVIFGCTVSGDIHGTYFVGGLVGSNPFVLGDDGGWGYIYSCSADVSVFGTDYVGGLMGGNMGEIRNCYALGSVEGENYIGGLIGSNNNTVTNCYATGQVIGNQAVGGLFGSNTAEDVVGCFWDTQTSQTTDGDGSRIPDPSGVVGLATTAMMTLSTFIPDGWDFVGEISNGTNDIWRMCVDGVEYPRLSLEFAENGDFACGDGVDSADLQALALNWLTLESDAPLLFNYACDANGDGQIDLEDYSVLSGNW